MHPMLIFVTVTPINEFKHFDDLTIYPCLKKAIARMMSGARYAAMPTSTMKAICRRILRNSFGVTLRFPLHHHQRATYISGVAARKSMAAPMQNRSHGHNLASSTIPSRVILNFPLLYFTEVLLLGAIKGLKQKALTVGAVQGLCFLKIGTEQLTFSAETGSR